MASVREIATHVFILLFFGFQNYTSTQAKIRIAHFTKETAISIQEKINQGCATLTPTRSKIECVIFCLHDVNCTGYSEDNNGLCYLHRACQISSSFLEGRITSEVESVVNYMVKMAPEKHCSHEGSWNKARNRCTCKYGWIGETCDVLATSVDDVMADGSYSYGFTYINLDVGHENRHPVRVLMYSDNTGRKEIIVLYSIGTQTSNRTYIDYVNGFEEGSKEQLSWIGLEALNQLSEAGCHKVGIDIQFRPVGASPMHFNWQLNMSVSNSLNGYRITVHSANSPITDWVDGNYNNENCFSRLQNTPFSTWDYDNDEDPTKNCAKLTGSGSWYTTCDNLYCNMFGVKPGSQTSPLGVVVVPGFSTSDLANYGEIHHLVKIHC